MLGITLYLYQKAFHELSCRGKLTEILPPTGEIIMQRMEVMIRYIDDEDQVLFESKLTNSLLRNASILVVTAMCSWMVMSH